MITHLTLTVQLTMADVAWHLHERVQTDDGDEPGSAVAGGRLPLSYGEADSLDAQQVLAYVVRHLTDPRSRRRETL